MNATFDTSGFFRMVNGLSTISGKDFESVLVDQVGQLLGVCIRYTHAADRQKIEQSVRFKNRNAKSGQSKISINKDGENVWLIENGRKYLASRNKLPAAKWARVLALTAALESGRIDPTVAVKSRGLSKSTWQQIADAIGAGDKTKAPGWVKGATTFKGSKIPKIGAAMKLLEGAAYFIEISNSSSLLINGPGPRFKGPRANLDGRAILQRAMNTRAKAFDTEMKRGVFQDIEQRVKRYPGIFTT